MRPEISGRAVNTTYTDVGSADFAGENICHPCKLDSSIPAADGPAIACCIIIVLISFILNKSVEPTANDQCTESTRLYRTF